ncbi:MAG: hypothetical protein CMO34_01880 [Verrucomicrobia bacterium]|nr:hypothetical protein [Verrucomicrobiota bacterium]
MLLYFIKRLFLFIPTLLLISLLVFALLQISGGDPALNALESNHHQSNLMGDEVSKIKDYRKLKKLDLPAFYFSVHRWSSSDTLYRLPYVQDKLRAEALSYASGDWKLVDQMDKEIKRLLQEETASSTKKQLNKILKAKSIAQIEDSFAKISARDKFDRLSGLISDLSSNQWKIKNYIPIIRIHGLNNQYHLWLTGILQGNFGSSFIDEIPVTTKIKEALPITLGISLCALLIALCVAVPLGVYSAYYQNGWLDKICSQLFFVFYALPTFWVATLLVVFLGTGDFLKWFPIYGIGNPDEGASFIEKLSIYSAHLTLPIFCYVYGGLAYLFRHIRRSTLEELKQDYFISAKAKGLNIHAILWRHLFKKSSFPLITILGNALPALISGSFVIEYIFSIEGVGMLMVEAFFSRDYPVILSLLLLGALLTLLGMWLADILYKLADPRVEIVGAKNPLK